MTAAPLRWWTVPRLNVVIRTHPVLVRAVLQKSTDLGMDFGHLECIFQFNQIKSIRDALRIKGDGLNGLHGLERRNLWPVL